MKSIRPLPSFFENIRYYVRTTPHSLAVESGPHRVTYREFGEHIEKVTRILNGLGLPADTRVGVAMRDPYLHWLTLTALSRLGLLNASVAEPARELAFLKAGVLIHDSPANVEGIQAVRVSRDWLARPLAELPPFEDQRFEADRPARIVLSSGTTGVPKKVLFTYQDLYERNKGVPRHYHVSAATRCTSMMGMSTIGGYQFPVTTWSNGGTVILPLARMDQNPAEFMLECAPNTVVMAPAHLAAVMEHLPAGFLPIRDLEIYLAGSVLTESLARKARLRLTSSVAVLYGSTEAGTVSIAHASTIDSRPGFAGVLVPGAEVEVLDEQGRLLPPGEQGVIRVRTDTMGRYIEEQGAAEGFIDGWFYPGDVGTVDSNGGLTIVGRVQQMMNLGGVKLSPELIENALEDLPGVKELAAFAVLDASGVDQLWIAVAAAEGFDPAPLHAAFQRRFPRLAAPSIARIDQIPRNQMGKVLRQRLRELVQRQLPPQVIH